MRVLVVEDEQAMAESLTWGLEAEGYVVDVADNGQDHAEGLDSGADDYLAKPFSYPLLRAHLRALTRRGLGAIPVVLTARGPHP
jgi:DNA-binding response OmpR family regulator